MHTDVRTMEGRTPSNAMSGSLPDILENHFADLDIGTRKKKAQGRMQSKEGEDLVEDDQFSQDINVLDQWKSLDKISFDDTDSSEWERSNSSSLSWFDESEQETTLKVKNMMDNIEKALYGETHSPLPKLTAEECQQWRLRFPHLRVVGKAVEINCVEVPKANNSLQVNDHPVTDLNHSHPCNEDEEDKEETYASHGTIEHEPLLSHEFQQSNGPSVDHESKVIQEALVDELTKHVWKEVVEPKIKEFMEKHSKKKEDESANVSFCKQRLSEACVTGSPRILEKFVKDKHLSFSDTQVQLPQSARELSHAVTSSSSNDEPFHRRHSDLISLSHRKCKNRLAPGRISEEKDEGEDMVTKKPENYWSALEAENRIGFNPRMPEINCLSGDAFKGSTPLEERLRLPSPSYLRSTEVYEKLKHREQSGISYNQRSRRKNERMKYSEEHSPQIKSDVRLPAIDDNKWSTNSETNKSLYGRSSSALPKLAPRTLRPTMSSYKTLYGERTASVMKRLPYKREISPVIGDIDAGNDKFNGSRRSSTIRARKEKLKKEKYHNL